MTTTTPHFTGEHHYDGEAHGPFSFLNPTTRRYPMPLPSPAADRSSSQEESPDEAAEGDVRDTKVDDENEKKGKENRGKKNDEIPASDVKRKWRSRDNRKGRHAITVTPTSLSNAKYLVPPPTSTLKATLTGVIRMFTTYPYWDVSYLVATVFTLGSVVWCINAFFVWLPLQDPATEFTGEITDGGGWTAWLGATIFEFGSILLMIEAVNENRADCFGWAVEEVLEEKGLRRISPSKEACVHHHRNKGNLVGKGRAVEGKPPLNTPMAPKDQPNAPSARTWTWVPTIHELRTHYIKEIGFLACSAQMFGATVFWISGFTALPSIYDRLTSTTAQNMAYWLPQVIGGSGFIVSGVLFMLETQQKWYLPAWKVLGWHIGVWNLLGGIGFTLCGALGFGAANSGCVYQGSLATFWGSWCFLIGSVIQWFESLDKHPVDVEEGGGRVSDTQDVTKK